MTMSRAAIAAVTVLLSLCMGTNLPGGMPSPLPTNWTKTFTPPWATKYSEGTSLEEAFRWQAISFFVAVLLGSAVLVRWTWNSLRRDLPRLPPLTFGRACSLVVLWGLLFVAILTMISGARELMTPGAWRKQGWTYKLADGEPLDTQSVVEREARRSGLEKLRAALWQHAAMHEGRFPARDNPAIAPQLWSIPGAPGLTFLYVADRHAEVSGRLLAFEPQIEGAERQVLLTNGMLGTMDDMAINRALRSKE